jgi:hypothetical protein
MKNTIKLLGIIALVTVIIFSMAACNRGTPVSAVDTFLTNFENFVEEVIPLMQQAMAGDEEAAASLAELEEKFEAMLAQFEDFSEDDVTPEQMEKFEELTGKLISAMLFF